MKKNVHVPGLAVIICAMLLTCGCSGSGRIKTNIVEGTITYEGQPLEGATVSFTPTGSQGDPAYAQTDAQGKYKLQTLRGEVDAGTTAGEYIVTISKYDFIPTGRKLRQDDGSLADETVPKLATPEVYMNQKETPFKATVVKGKNKFDFKLNKDGT